MLFQEGIIILTYARIIFGVFLFVRKYIFSEKIISCLVIPFGDMISVAFQRRKDVWYCY
jgi:hypothetical protein